MRQYLLTVLLGLVVSSPSTAAQRSGLDNTKVPLAGGTMTGPLGVLNSFVTVSVTGSNPAGVGVSSTPEQGNTNSMPIFIAFDPANQVSLLGSSYNWHIQSSSTGVVDFKMNAGKFRGINNESLSFPGDGSATLKAGNSTVGIDSGGNISLSAPAGSGSLSVSATGYAIINAPAGVEINGGQIHVGLVTVTNTCPTSTGCSASCSGSTFLTGGGCSNGASSVALTNTFPSSNSWSCDYASTVNITAYALCSRLAQ
jgi:hypothetical protein